MASASGVTTPPRGPHHQELYIRTPERPHKRRRTADAKTEAIAKRALALSQEAAEKSSPPLSGKLVRSNSAVSSQPFGGLPTELIQEIACTLSPNSLNALGMTSKSIAEQTEALRKDIGWVPKMLIDWVGGTDKFIRLPKVQASCAKGEDPLHAFIEKTHATWALQQSSSSSKGASAASQKTPLLFTDEHPFVRGEVMQEGKRTVFFAIPVRDKYTSAPIFPDPLLEDEDEDEEPDPSLDRSLMVIACNEKDIEIEGSFLPYEQHFVGTWAHYDVLPTAEERLDPLLKSVASFLKEKKEQSDTILPANQLGDECSYRVLPGWE